jgi:pimeloyl-ACP methyl ester carboxylesterase
MPYIKSKDNLDIYYKKYEGNPDKIPLFFIHGWLVNWTYFRKIINYYKKKDHPIYAIDLRGHGRSELPKEDAELDTKKMASDIEEIANKEKIDNFALIGHSMGGMVSILYAINNSYKLSNLILLNTTYANPIMTGRTYILGKNGNWVSKFCSFILKKFKPKLYKQKVMDFSKMEHDLDEKLFFRALSNLSLHNSLRYIKVLEDYKPTLKKLKKIKIPTLIIGCNRDQFFPKSTTYKLKKKIPNSKCIILKGTHNIPMKKPEEIIKQIDEFIKTN